MVFRLTAKRLSYWGCTCGAPWDFSLSKAEVFCQLNRLKIRIRTEFGFSLSCKRLIFFELQKSLHFLLQFCI